ncbi:hypothetical protein E2C01_013587 [Portunus trituberculatus]|uniref:Uncharacterized protein n=1 Tax=Portunus trituberculatus TaxID=210409 RepID=A0A5B7DHS0_PORTR|nr:hypothetical protein [Portunus trituberculatus]
MMQEHKVTVFPRMAVQNDEQSQTSSSSRPESRTSCGSERSLASRWLQEPALSQAKPHHYFAPNSIYLNEFLDAMFIGTKLCLLHDGIGNLPQVSHVPPHVVDLLTTETTKAQMKGAIWH